jgi:hypothetical protein
VPVLYAMVARRRASASGVVVLAAPTAG